MNANRKFKDSVFTMLFNDEALLRELYCALEGVDLPDDTPISINTLEHALIRDVYNDISFIVGSKLVVLVEHQSTVNPNMALRLLMYIAESYKQMVKNKNVYSGKKVSIPYPVFYVLYDGPDPYPDEKVLKLSDLFENIEGLALPEKNRPLLELEVKVLNINEGKNVEVVNRCRKLAEYGIFSAKVREFREAYDDLLKAIKEAVKYCKEHDILKGYLEKHETEVINMLYTEWNIDTAIEVAREEAFEDGVERGIERGIEQGIEKNRQYVLELLKQGLSSEEIEQRLMKTAAQ